MAKCSISDDRVVDGVSNDDWAAKDGVADDGTSVDGIGDDEICNNGFVVELVADDEAWKLVVGAAKSLVTEQGLDDGGADGRASANKGAEALVREQGLAADSALGRAFANKGAFTIHSLVLIADA